MHHHRPHRRCFRAILLQMPTGTEHHVLLSGDLHISRPVRERGGQEMPEISCREALRIFWKQMQDGRVKQSKMLRKSFMEAPLWPTFFSQGHDEWGIFQHDNHYSPLPDIIIGAPISRAIQTTPTDSVDLPGGVSFQSCYWSANCNVVFICRFSCRRILQRYKIATAYCI